MRLHNSFISLFLFKMDTKKKDGLKAPLKLKLDNYEVVKNLGSGIKSKSIINRSLWTSETGEEQK